MSILAGVRLLAIAVLWPATAWLVVHHANEVLSDWFGVLELGLLATAGSGALVAALFSQWRITGSFLLVLLAWAGLRLANTPESVALLAVLGIALLPWFRERGITGLPSLLAGAMVLISAILWLRGGTPAQVVDELLRTPLSVGGLTIELTPLLVLVALLLLAIRLLVRQQAPEVGLGGALTAMFALTLTPVPGTMALATTVAASLALWTGLLMHTWRLAYLDELTGLPNRRALDDQLRSLPGRWCLAMLDVDHFKKFNDRWGHDVGDQVLRRVAFRLAQVGQRGRAYRYGGEEFAVVFPHDDPDRAAEAVELVRTRLGNEPFRIRGPREGPKKRGRSGKGKATEQRITASAGLAVATRGESAAETFKRADQALYKAKSKGRNRLVRAS